MDILDFIKMTNGEEQNIPNGAVAVCLSVISEQENDEGEKVLVSNIDKQLNLTTPIINMDCFIDGRDENGYVSVSLNFKSPLNKELSAAWNMLEEYRKVNDLTEIDFDTDVEVRSDTIVELMIMPRESLKENPIFLECAFPISMCLSVDKLGQQASCITMFFNLNSCIFHEDEFDMESLEKEVNKLIADMEEAENLQRQREQEEIERENERIMREAELKKWEAEQEKQTKRIVGRTYDD